MRRTLDGVLLDSQMLWTFLALLTLFAFLVWGAITIQNHYYFDTTPFNIMGKQIP